jgi:uncharacterized protein (DUF305 family)
MTPAEQAAQPSVFQRWGRRGTGIVLGLAALVMLLIGATVGLALGSSNSASPSSADQPSADSVDVGFLRDMTVHHEQGVLLAHVAQGNGGSAGVAGIAYDIEYQQTSQIGQMGGFLLLWGYSLNGNAAPMAWMTDAGGQSGMTGMAAMTVDPSAAADGAIMPGMATHTEIARLKTLRGADSDSYFLQLMIRHHQGGVPMMDYAAQHATNPVVQNMALKMSQAQVAEITSMTTLLEDTFKGTPLPSPGAVSTGSATPGDGSTVTAPTSAADGVTGMSGMQMTAATS